MRIIVAFRAFFATLFRGDIAEQFAQILSGTAAAAEKSLSPQQVAATPPHAQPQRSEAITLLATLQREARFVDFVKESLDGASDEQIGAVVRDVHRDCAAVLERLLAIRPLRQEVEGADIDVPPDFDAVRFRLTGNVQGAPPYRGKLVHQGWHVTRSELPSWTGSSASAQVICPAEVEL